MVMGKAAAAIELDATERWELQSLARAQKTGQAMARRARIVLAAAAGMENQAICVEVGADANTVGKWRRRFAADRLDGLLDEPPPGTPRKIADTICQTLETRPDGATHWSLRLMAEAVGYAPSTVHRIWRAFGRSRTGPRAQAVNRHALCRKGSRHRGPLSIAARASAGALRR